MASYLLAHDLGTSGNKATLYTLEGELKSSYVCGYDTLYPQNRHVEQRAGDWWDAVCGSTRLLLERSGVQNTEIAAVSFSGQMMGCLLVDRAGNSLHNAMIWADTRSDRQERRMIEAAGMEAGYRITGHRLSASYSAAKLLWIKDNFPEIYRKAYRMLHAKEYVIFRLTGQFVSEYSDASSTNLMDIEKKQWSEELTYAFEIRKELLPELYPSATIAGRVTAEAARQTGLAEGTPVVIGGGDGSCACVGAGVVDSGTAYGILGSSSWISYASKTPQFDEKLSTFNFVHLDQNLYTPTGTMQAAGLSYSWYRDALCAEEVRVAAEQRRGVYEILDEAAAKSSPGANGLLYLPYLLGERSPRWDHDARGAFIGMGISTGKADMTRAVLEGVGYNLKVILDIFEQGLPVERLVLIGGGAKGSLWMQILADIWQKELLVPRYLEEATSMGAAICAGVGVGVFPNFIGARRFNPIERVVRPNPENAAVYNKLYAAFNMAYDGLRETYRHLAQPV